MSEENVVRLCAPTLAGIKTGRLFPCPYENRETLLMEIRQYNQVLVPKGLCLLPLRFTDKSALLYLYRPRDLEWDLQDQLAAEILRHAGYVCGSSEQCLMKLIERLRAYDEFPHEIGLFLSYPPEDVKGFLEHRPCKCVGCWKVYENEEAAKKTFAKYKACTRVYCRQLASGIDIERLTVAG